MRCSHPLEAFQARYPDKDGKRPVSFERPAFSYEVISLACGQCILCRLEYSKIWMIRNMHEAKMHEESIFVTLTYREEQLPAGGSLVPRHFQLFMKRLRKHFGDRRIRFFMCGEYGDSFDRPHYHALLYGCDFDDKRLYSEDDGYALFTSDTCDRLWSHGYCVFGDITPENAAYVARYSLKKVNGDGAIEHYSRVCPIMGVEYQVEPEFALMSRRPGIGRDWYDKYRKDTFDNDRVVVGGRVFGVPRYYDMLFEEEDPEAFAVIKENRRHCDRESGLRLYSKEVIAEQRFKEKGK